MFTDVSHGGTEDTEQLFERFAIDTPKADCLIVFEYLAP